MSPSWRYLDGFGAPLLFRYAFGPSNCSIWLTDLTYVWTETLDRKSIIQRSFSLDTSIDPSEDSSQMQLLLSSVETALAQKPGTDIRVTAEAGGERITLRLTVPLPAPLAPLKWNFNLRRCAAQEFTREVVMPLLLLQVKSATEKRSLFHHLKEKDNVISKLINQMQADGCDMSKVFPGSVFSKSSSRTDVRQVLSKSVKGISEFKKQEWQTQVDSSTNLKMDSKSLLLNITPIEHFESATDLGETKTEWWFSSKTPPGVKEGASAKTTTFESPDEKTQASVTDGGRSQGQTTPSRAQTSDKSKSPARSQYTKPEYHHYDDSTTDDSDEGLAQQPKPTLPSSAKPSGEVQQAENPTIIEKQKGEPDKNDSTDSSDDAQQPGPRQFEHQIQAKNNTAVEPTRPRAKLGRIGGKKATGAKTEDPPAQDELTVRPKSADAMPESPRAAGLGVNKSPTIADRHKPSNAQSTLSPGAGSPPSETPQERADRNRDRLKRELDAKSHATNKKKRKF